MPATPVRVSPSFESFTPPVPPSRKSTNVQFGRKSILNQRKTITDQRQSIFDQRRNFFEQRKKFFNKRKLGYGNLDDWNALPEADQARIRGHSVNLLKSFQLTKLFLQLEGRFPFIAKKLEDGSYTFTMDLCSISYIIFFLTSILIIVIFTLFTIGGFSIFTHFEPSKHLHDRCGNFWGQAILSRNMPAIMFVWSQWLMTAAGSVYIIIHGRSFMEFYNVVNEAVMQLDADPTNGMFWNNIRGTIVFGSLFIACIVLAVTDSLHSLDEVSVFIVQCICYLFAKDIYTAGHKPFSADDYDLLFPDCHKCDGCYNKHGKGLGLEHCARNNCYNSINTPSTEYKVASWIGLCLIAFSLMGARSLIRQFEFFCQVLVNMEDVWNKRFLNYAARDVSMSMDDVYRRRITDQLILKDHYEIVKLFNETEKNFSFILFVYYTSVFFNMICQFYYLALLSTQVTCSLAVHREQQAALDGKCYSFENESINIDPNNNTYDVLHSGLGNRNVVSFEDACSLDPKELIRHASITTTVLIIVTLSSFTITTLGADRASHQADIGFYRVRKRGYLSCRTKKERNAMHSLVFSFTGPKPFCITAAGYFPIRKKTIVVITSVAFVYFLIILSFKPGQNYADVRCYNYGSKSHDKVYQVKYPMVI